ncbi:MAG TPA: ankyrin repeat domain-containing protein [Stellaceae bacterium]|nr:ankyrin repeat domain-containing protein [Stellaceae bacterium]
MTARSARLCGSAVLALCLLMASARADISLFGSYWDNVARMAAQNDASAVQRLVAGGNDPNEEDDQGRTGLLVSAINGNLQIAAILIKAGAHLDVKDRLGNTPLSYAAERDHVELAQLLLDLGAAVDPQNRNGMTPLMIAASRGETAIVEALLAKGADPHKTDYTGRDAVSWGADSHRQSVILALRRAVAHR